MLADITEAAVRTLNKPTAAKLEKFIQGLIDAKVEHGQLVESELTFRDLETIKKAFVRVLAGYYHSRIEYPKLKEPGSGEAAARETAGKEPTAKEAAARETAGKEPVAKEPVAKEPVAKEAGAKEPDAKEEVAKEAGVKEARRKKAPAARAPSGSAAFKGKAE
jgi:hypothetical protein